MATTARVLTSSVRKSSSLLPAPETHRFQLSHATAGDHPHVHHLLLATCFGPSASEFHCQNEEPRYEPRDRLLVRFRGELVAHALTSKRTMHFGPLRLPVAELRDLATLPEFRRLGLGSGLVAAAEKHLSEQGALVVWSRSPAPEFFLRRGWTPAARKVCTLVEPRTTLAWLHEQKPSSALKLGETRRPLNIRLWRHVEQDPLMRLHAQGVAESYGPWQRTEEYWHWLISRHGYDKLYVAIDGPDRLELTDVNSPLVGYAVARENRIVEVVTAPGHEHVARELLMRICGDAVERNEHRLRFEGPPAAPLQTLLLAAGGKPAPHSPTHAEFAMAKVLHPEGLLRALLPLLGERWKLADSGRAVELGLDWGDDKFLLQLGARSVKLVAGRSHRNRLVGSAAALSQVLLGYATPATLSAAGSLDITTRAATEVAEVLFPKLPLWLPAFDELPA